LGKDLTVLRDIPLNEENQSEFGEARKRWEEEN